MQKFIRLSCLLVVCASLFSFRRVWAEDPPGGLIGGTVVDERGGPVPGIKVFLGKADGRIKMNAMRHARSDGQGRFAFSGLPSGQYRVYAMSEDLGYPDTTFEFYAQNPAPLIQVDESGGPSDMFVTVGPKAGVIAGTVVDKTTRAPVNATFVLADVIEPSRWISTSVPAKFRILVPPGRNITVSVSAPGYDAWNYSSHTTHNAPLRVASGEEVSIDVELSPSQTGTSKK
jgi:carboxypeptidase family protein